MFQLGAFLDVLAIPIIEPNNTYETYQPQEEYAECESAGLPSTSLEMADCEPNNTYETYQPQEYTEYESARIPSTNPEKVDCVSRLRNFYSEFTRTTTLIIAFLGLWFLATAVAIPIIMSPSPNCVCPSSQTTKTEITTTPNPTTTTSLPTTTTTTTKTTTTVQTTTPTATEPKPKDAVLILNTFSGLNTQPVITDVNGRNDANLNFRYGQVSKSALSNQ